MYDYQTQRPFIFTEKGLKRLLQIRDHAFYLAEKAGAVRADKVMTGDAWETLACLDFLVEQGDLIEITGSKVFGQHRIFVKTID